MRMLRLRGVQQRWPLQKKNPLSPLHPLRNNPQVTFQKGAAGIVNNKGLLYLSGKNLNDIYTLRIPESLLQFCRFDFSVFTARCNELRAVAMKSGERWMRWFSCATPFQVVISIMKKTGVFQRIVTDCWIDALSKQTDKGTTALWNSLIGAKTPYEKSCFRDFRNTETKAPINTPISFLTV